MGVTREQLEQAPIGSKLINTGLYEVICKSDGWYWQRAVDRDSYPLYDNETVSCLILANSAVELVPPERKVAGWEVKCHRGGEVDVTFSRHCWDALQAFLAEYEGIWGEGSQVSGPRCTTWKSFQKAKWGEK